jgi:DNA mismatch endonuclease, patch repair protein
MARILGKNTKPEIKVRQLLHSRGYRFRLHQKDLPGKPDIVLSRHKTVVFIHGCFWHLHGRCRDGTTPKTRVVFWSNKLLANKKRDAKNAQRLRRKGWRVLRFWECEIEKRPDAVSRRISKALKI